MKTTSRDLALIAMFVALSFVFKELFGQIEAFTGIPGSDFALTIVYSIIQSVAYLMYGGRRWRILAQALLINLLYLLFIPTWIPPVLMATILNWFIVDIVFNSFYGKFERDNRLFRWILALQIYSWTTYSFMLLPFLALFISTEVAITYFVTIGIIWLPITIAQAVAGSYIGYKIFRRVERISE
jgi:hypothetical protein